MNSLSDLQQAFLDSIETGEDRVSGRISRAGGADPKARLAIYANAYQMRLREALRETYALTHAWLGDHDFEAACARHIASGPSRTRNLRDYGNGFDEAIAAVRRDAPEACDLARLEYALRLAFDGPDSEPFDAARLAALTEREWETAGVRLHPTFALVTVGHNAAALWQALKAEVPPPDPEPLPHPTPIRVWRRDVRPHFRTIDQDEARALTMLADGKPFAEVAMRFGPEQSGQWLSAWIGDGLIADLRLADE